MKFIISSGIKIIAFILQSMLDNTEGFLANQHGDGYHSNDPSLPANLLSIGNQPSLPSIDEFHPKQTLPFFFKRMTAQTAECRVNNELQRKMGQWTSLSNTKYPSPVLQQIYSSPLPLDIEFLTPPSDSPPLEYCPVHDMSTSDPLNERSICSWTWKKNYDPRRLPSLLFEANCLCNKAAKILSSFADYECEPVVYKVRVLRFDQPCQKYKQSHENLVVACAAVARASHASNRGVLDEDNDSPFIEI